MRFSWLSIFGVLLWPVLPLQAQQMQAAGATGTADTLSRHSLFDDWLAKGQDDIMNVTLVTNVGQLIKKKAAEEYQPAQFAFSNANGVLQQDDIQIRSRGVTRKDICGHPPIKLKFAKAKILSAGYGPYNEMKVVWQCKPGRLFEQLLFKEYLVYRLYNIISPNSYRVKLVKFDLVDSRDTSKHTPKFGFIIEDDDQFTWRLEGKLYEEPIKNASRFNREAMLRLFVFQYMIGNTDWSFGNAHNLKLLGKGTNPEKIFPVPYDFDYAGVVNAPYAVPHESLPIKSVRERHYQGVDCSESEITALNNYFLAVKPAIVEYCSQFPYLDDINRKDILSYLDEFFAELERKGGLMRVINTLK